MESPARSRVIDAALDLFAEHGVSGTSLQMIADRIGVTKAAVYHQFPTKDEIVQAVAARELAGLEDAIAEAEAQGSAPEARAVLLAHVVDVAVARRGLTAFLQTDPIVVRFLAEHEPFQQVTERLYAVLAGPDATPESQIPAAMVTAAIGGAVNHPLVADLDDETLRAHLLRLAQRLLDVPDDA